MQFLDKEKARSSIARAKHAALTRRVSLPAAIGTSGRKVAYVRAVGKRDKRPLDTSKDGIDPTTETRDGELPRLRSRRKIRCRRVPSSQDNVCRENGQRRESSSDVNNTSAGQQVAQTHLWVDAKTLCKLVEKSPVGVSVEQPNPKEALDSQAAIETQVVDEARRLGTVVFDEMLKVSKQIEHYEEKLATIGEQLTALRSTEAVQVSALKAECAAKVCSLEDSVHRLDVEIAQMDRDRSLAEEELRARKCDLKHRIEYCRLSQDTQEIDEFRRGIMDDLENLLKPVGTNRTSVKLADLKAKRTSIKEELRATSDDYKKKRENLSIVCEVRDCQEHRSQLYAELDWLQAKYSELAYHSKGMS